MDFEKPLMDKGLQPGSQKSLFPSRKTEQEMMIFKEIFVEPKEKELEKLKDRAKLEQEQYEMKISALRTKKKTLKPIGVSKNVDLNHSNMINSSFHNTKKASIDNYLKAQNEFSSDEEEEEEKFRSTFTHKFNINEEPNILNSLIEDSNDSIIKIVLQKFNHRKHTDGNNSFLVQQIHVQPPDGLNSTVSGPLTPGGGWAPSIPHTNPNLSKTSLKDMTIRAKAGIQAGDVQKEAHMAYNLALLNESKKNLKKAIRFYKRFFFCARLLEDPVGAALALNRIGVAYHKLKKFDKSFSFHKKHLEFTDSENIYAAYYNSGIALRFQKQFAESIDYFKNSLEWSRKRQDSASECLS
jgi:tetratricopeptide (TPR) repeat protein